jgi:hypothetical protein
MGKDPENDTTDRAWEDSTRQLWKKGRAEWARSQREQKKVARLIKETGRAEEHAKKAALDAELAERAGRDLLEKLDRMETEEE